MQLGALIRRLEDEDNAVAALAALADAQLADRVASASVALGQGPGQYIAMAARRFANQAGHEQWMALMSAMERGGDPGAAALRVMLGWMLAMEGHGSNRAPGGMG